MFWPQGGRRENLFLGHSAHGWFQPSNGVRVRMGQALRCWKTDDGGAVCSNLMYYSPNCPTTPPITEAQTLPTPPEAAGAS